MDPDAARPWYREPWPWLLMAGPAIVVVAGINMMFVAWRTHDGLVADDYYKQGLAINRVIARDAQARRLGLRATVQLNEATGAVRVLLSGGEAPAALRLKLVHPTLAAEDRSAALARAAPGIYEGRIERPNASAWRVQLEDDGAHWRLSGRWPRGAQAMALGG